MVKDKRKNIALTVDVEDYFQVSAFEDSIKPTTWDNLPHRVEDNTNKILDVFDEFSLKATFFVLGWVAQRYPQLVKRISESGHEVCCHGYNHQRITTLSQESFKEDITSSRKLLQDISGQEVNGYRAPSYTITKQTIWALDELIDAGFTYDSSIFPIHHDLYGMPDAKRFPHSIDCKNGKIKEFPPSTVEYSLLGKRVTLPFSGGGYLRLLPAPLISNAYKSLENKGQPSTLYFHPWEIDPMQPRMKGPLKSRFRHYVNLSKTENKLRYLFKRHSFAPMGKVLNEVLPNA